MKGNNFWRNKNEMHPSSKPPSPCGRVEIAKQFRGGVLAVPQAKHKNGEGIVMRAKSLRQTGSMIERILWKILRENPEQKAIKFRFQHPLSHYVVDFACLSAKLVVEVDGMSHDGTDKQDKVRQAFIESLGYKVLRFSNEDVLKRVDDVAEAIRYEARERLKEIQKETPPRKR